MHASRNCSIIDRSTATATFRRAKDSLEHGYARTQRKAYMANGSLVQGRMDQLNSIGFKWVLKERSTKRGAEPGEERNTPSALSLKVPPKRSDDWKESDDEVDEIGALIYDQAMRQR